MNLPKLFGIGETQSPSVDLRGAYGSRYETGEAGTYTMLRLDGPDVTGLYEMESERREQGVPPSWMSYVSVEIADETAGRVRELGGTVVPPMEVGEGGRILVALDPQGASFALLEGETDD